MSGFCYNCASRFGTFNKELGCKNCGFAFCKKCLAKKIALPQHNNSKHAVCNKCYDTLTGKTSVASSAAFAPPDAYYKRIAALDSKGTQPQLPAQQQVANTASPTKQKGLSQKDDAMAKRLQQLKDSTKPANVPSQSEIEARLLQLKQGEAGSAESGAAGAGARQNQPHVFKADRRTQQEQIDALLEEIGDEVEIDARAPAYVDPATSIQSRLDRLKTDANAADGSLNDMSKRGSTRVTQPSVNTVNIPNRTEDNSETSDVENLMRQVAAEMHVDAQRAIEELKKDKELWNRVEQIKQDAAARQKGTGEDEAAADVDTASNSDSEDEETATKRLIQQLMEESRLDEKVGFTDKEPTPTRSKKSADKNTVRVSEKAAEPATDELPWCCICNEDATLRCKGCDGDLYCQRCFKEGHDQWDIQEHKTVRYSAPAQSNR